MENLKTFEQFTANGLLEADFEKYLPPKIEIIKNIEGKVIHREFEIGNIMRHANMTQIIYTADIKQFGHPDEMSIDFYYYQNGSIKLAFDIIYGDFVSCSFSITPPNNVELIEYTSYHSKFDPSNTVFAFSDKSIRELCSFINTVDGFKVDENDFDFLNSRDDYNTAS